MVIQGRRHGRRLGKNLNDSEVVNIEHCTIMCYWHQLASYKGVSKTPKCVEYLYTTKFSYNIHQASLVKFSSVCIACIILQLLVAHNNYVGNTGKKVR